jgi:hypothetical protein
MPGTRHVHVSPRAESLSINDLLGSFGKKNCRVRSALPDLLAAATPAIAEQVPGPSRVQPPAARLSGVGSYVIFRGCARCRVVAGRARWSRGMPEVSQL